MIEINSTKQSVFGHEQVAVAASIDFGLRTLDFDHPYLMERGFATETIRHFGLTYCTRGMLKGRVAIPVHDPDGQLVGYAGWLTRDTEISETNPEYLFSGTREKDSIMSEFRKSLLLYNAHSIAVPVEHLYVVNGLPATWWLWQAKYHNTVALMGSNCSDEQAELISHSVKCDGVVWVITDGDDAGDRCAYSFLPLISRNRTVRWVACEEGYQPTDYQEVDLAKMLEK